MCVEQCWFFNIQGRYLPTKKKEVCGCRWDCEQSLQSPLPAPVFLAQPLAVAEREGQSLGDPGEKLFSSIPSQGIKHCNFCLLQGKAGIFLCIISWFTAKGWKFTLKIHNSCLKCRCLVPAIPPEWPRDIYKTSIIFWMFVVIHLETDERRFLTNDVTYVDSVISNGVSWKIREEKSGQTETFLF